MKKVKLFRVKVGSSGQLPKGFPEGMITGLTKLEFESLSKQSFLKECFEEIKIVSEYEDNKTKVVF